MLASLSVSLEFCLKQAVLCARSHLKISLIGDDLKTGINFASVRCDISMVTEQAGATLLWQLTHKIDARCGSLVGVECSETGWPTRDQACEPERLTQKAGWSGSACLSVSEIVVASAPTCPMAILFPSVECPVSPGGHMVRTSMIHAVWQHFIWAVGSGRAGKSIELLGLFGWMWG